MSSINFAIFSVLEKRCFMTLKERIKNLCKERNVSLNKVEEDLGFGKGYLSKLDKSKPNISKIQKMADYFGVSVDWLMGGTEDRALNNHLLGSELNNIFLKLSTELGMSKEMLFNIFMDTNFDSLPEDKRDITEENIRYAINQSPALHNTPELKDGLNSRDRRDIAKDVNSIMEKLSNKEYGPAAYDGQELTELSAELFKEELEIALKRLKLINKEKYNPNKNKK